MSRASKRAKTTATPKAISDAGGPSSNGAAATPKHCIPFQTGPSLERIPDDILHEILSYLPTIEDRHAELVLVRTPILRVLSRTSPLLRSRCLALAWQNVTFSGAKIPKGDIVFFKAIGDTIKIVIRVLKASPHLLPLVQFVYRTEEWFLTSDHRLEKYPSFCRAIKLIRSSRHSQVVSPHYPT